MAYNTNSVPEAFQPDRSSEDTAILSKYAELFVEAGQILDLFY